VSDPEAGAVTGERAAPGRPPAVSVVIPCYDRPDFLERAVRSALAQTLDDLEVLVIDDGSAKDLKAILDRLGDPRVRYLRSPAREGAPRARNRGIRLARGEWVAFLDDDDEWLPRRLELQLARMRETGATVGYCLVLENKETEDRTRLPTDALHEGVDEVLEQLLSGNKTQTSTYMIRRDVLEEVGGFDEAMPSAHDADLLFRLALRGYAFAAVNEVLVHWYEHGREQLTHDPERKLRGFRALVRRWGRIYRDRLGSLAFLRWKLKRYRQLDWIYERGIALDRSGGRAARAARRRLRLWLLRLETIPTRVEIFVRKRLGGR